MYNAYHGRGYDVLAINLGESNDKVKPFARQYSYTFLRDSSLSAWNIYKMDQGYTPLNYVIDTAGLVVNSMEGTFDSLTVDGWIQPYLAGVEETPNVRPLGFTTVDANPVVGHSTVRFNLPKAASVTLRVYSTSGALVRTLCNGQMPAGANTVNWDLRDYAGRPVSNGLYLYELNTGSQAAQAKVSVLK
jgi:hypothetical protein